MTVLNRPLTVTIPTFRRPERLPRLVHTIRLQYEQLETVAAPVRIVIIDNDPHESARSVADGLGVEYEPEHEPGIAAARQRALDVAARGELVVMIDDDLLPEDGWLADLITTWTSHRPAVVMGFVRYVWPPDTDPLVAAGGFMRRREFRDGEALDHLATGNVLIDIDQVRSLDVTFDRGLGLAGGEDSLFGKAVLARGGTVVASKSTAQDRIPAERTTWKFVRARAIGHGQTTVYVQLYGRSGVDGFVGRAQSLVGGSVRWAVFSGWRLVGRLVRNVPLEAAGTRRSWFAIGRMQAAIGHRHDEYAR